jgi:lipoprotein-anchoring transpeptidase ErfK/SrfK
LTAVLGPTSLARHRGALLVAVMAALAVTGGCVGDRPTLASEAEPTTTTLDDTTTTTPGSETMVAQANGDAIDLFDSATSSTPSGEITADEATAAPDIPLVFLVRREQGERLEVYLPTPPIGSTGWVRADDVAVSKVTFRIVVSLGDHRLRVFDDDLEVLDEPVSIGRSDRPDPGRYYIKELLQPSDADGPYGAYAYGFGGFTTSLDSFAEGTGIVGIHGTDDPDALGTNVATGCIGLENSVIERLVDDLGLPLGTPVQVTR